MQFIESEKSITDKLGVNNWGIDFNLDKTEDRVFHESFDWSATMMNTLPITYVRLGNSLYDKMFKENGMVDFSRLDQAVSLIESYGLKIIMPIFFLQSSTVSYEEAKKNMRTMLYQLVDHYTGHGFTYEVFDEPTNAPAYWYGVDYKRAKEDIIQLSNYFCHLVTSMDKSAEFCAGDYPFIGGNSDWEKIADNIARGGLELANAKYGSYHPYIIDNPERMLTNPYHERMLNTIKNHGLIPMATEYGYAHGDYSNFNGSYTRQQQSDYLIRQTLLLDALGFDKIIAWTMDNTDRIWAMEQNVYDSDAWRDRKPRWNQHGLDYQQFFYQLQGFRFKENLSKDKHTYIFRYVRSGDEDRLVIWRVGESTHQQIMGQDLWLEETPHIYKLRTERRL